MNRQRARRGRLRQEEERKEGEERKLAEYKPPKGYGRFDDQNDEDSEK